MCPIDNIINRLIDIRLIDTDKLFTNSIVKRSLVTCTFSANVNFFLQTRRGLHGRRGGFNYKGQTDQASIIVHWTIQETAAYYEGEEKTLLTYS